MSLEDRLDAAIKADESDLFEATVNALGFDTRYAYLLVLYALLPWLTDLFYVGWSRATTLAIRSLVKTMKEKISTTKTPT